METRKTGLPVVGLIGVLLAGFMLFGFGCAKKKEGGGAAQPLSGEPSSEVARVDGEVITLGEVNRVVSAWKSGRFPQVDPSTPEGEMQKRAVDELIGQKLLFAQATRAGTVPTDEEVRASIDQMKQSNALNDSTFESALKQQGLNVVEFTTGFKMDTAVRKFVKSAIQDTIKVTPEQVRAYFDTHADQFQRPEQVHARHILVRVDKTATPDQDAAALQKIQGIQQELSQGKDFAALAQQDSEDPGSKERGGDLGFFSKGAMVPPFDSVAFALEPGQTSGPVRTQFGYHLIQSQERKPSGPMAFEQVQGRLMQMLYSQRTGDRVKALVDELKSRAKIKRKI